MDLKDVIAKVNEQAMEAHNAYHAGHAEKIGVYFARIKDVINKAFSEYGELLGDVTESATSEKQAENLEETQAKVSGPDVHPAVIDPDGDAQAPGVAQPFEKPLQ